MDKIKEKDIQYQIEQYLIIQEKQGKLVFQKNNSGALKTDKGGFVRFGKKGAPDFLIFLPNNKTIHCEVKNKKGKQSIYQKEYQRRVEKLGHKYIIVRSLDDLIKIL